MANIKDTAREEILDKVERLFVMGFRKPYQIQKLLSIGDFKTAENYLRVAVRRLHRRFDVKKSFDRDKELRDQVMMIDRALNELWTSYLGDAKGVSEKTGVINSIQGLLKNKAELLGLEAPKDLNVGIKGDSLWDVLQKMPANEREAIIKSIAAYSKDGNARTA